MSAVRKKQTSAGEIPRMAMSVSRKGGLPWDY